MVKIDTKLHQATPREAAADAVYRCLTALDISDLALFRSAFTTDAEFHLNGDILKGIDQIIVKCYDQVSGLDTTHSMSNPRIQISSDGLKAEMTGVIIAQHFLRGQAFNQDAKNLLVGHLHEFELVVEDQSEGLFKIKKWVSKLVWARGELQVGKVINQ